MQRMEKVKASGLKETTQTSEVEAEASQKTKQNPSVEIKKMNKQILETVGGSPMGIQ